MPKPNDEVDTLRGQPHSVGLVFPGGMKNSEVNKIIQDIIDGIARTATFDPVTKAWHHRFRPEEGYPVFYVP